MLGKYFVMPNNVLLVRWQSRELKVATRWYVTTVASISAIAVMRQLMVTITSGLLIHPRMIKIRFHSLIFTFACSFQEQVFKLFLEVVFKNKSTQHCHSLSFLC